MKKIFSFILCVIMVCSAFALTGCKDKNAVGKAWQVKEYVTTEVVVQKVGFTVSRNSSSIKDVWINIQEIEGENVQFTFSKYKSKTDKTSDLEPDGSYMGGSANAIVISAQQVKDANKNAKGWIKVNSADWNLASDKVLMTVKGKVTIREIVFVNMKGERVSASINKAFVVVETGKKKDRVITLKEFTALELEAYVETAVCGIPNFLLDNQEAFDTRNA